MITPMEIHNREFKKTFRGYSENEVDEFLDRIVVDYEKTLRENDKLRDQLNLNNQEVENYKKLEKNLQDTLSVAQKTADEILSNAKKSANELREQAARDTQNIYNNTMQETQNIREQAQLESKRLLDDAAHKLKIIVNEYDKIVREKNSFLLKVRTALESELAVTSQLLTSVPHTDDLAELKASLAKIESENKIATTNSAKPQTKKVEPEDEVVIEKVSQVVTKPEPEKKAEVKPAKVFSNTRTYAESKQTESKQTESDKVSAEKKPAPSEEDLDKTMVFKPIKKSAE